MKTKKEGAGANGKDGLGVIRRAATVWWQGLRSRNVWKNAGERGRAPGSSGAVRCSVNRTLPGGWGVLEMVRERLKNERYRTWAFAAAGT